MERLKPSIESRFLWPGLSAGWASPDLVAIQARKDGTCEAMDDGLR